MSSTAGRTINHAVVIGGSIAGLLAARVLVEHAHQVTIIDRDHLPEGCERRRGVPQSAHVHALLPGGAAVVEQLLPGFAEEIAAAGAPRLDLAADISWLTPFGWGARFPSGLFAITGSRVLIEWAVRRRVLDLPGIDVLGGTGVVGPVGDHHRVHGVRLGDGREVAADVVVDASGRTSRAPDWLRALGCEAPAETVVDADLGYASLVIEAPADAIDGARAGYVQVAPPGHLRGGIAFPLEGGRWLLTLVGTGGDHPPRDPAGFEAFAGSLRHPILADLLAAGRPVGPIAVFGATANRFRHYERLDRRPAGLLVTGDAACAFNPVYGQGMSAAALATEALAACLRRDPTPRGLADRFPVRLRAAVKVPWMLATAADFDVAGIRPPLPVRTMNRYVARVMAASTDSVPARLGLLRVMGLTRSPLSLFGPRVVTAALSGHRRPPTTVDEREAVRV